MNNKSIGIFDSGLGGLTVVSELRRVLPGEDIVYFGDTGRVPYGTRSRETIERYARQDIDFLLGQDVKFIIAACGTVSSVAAHVGDGLPVPFAGVVNPAAIAAANITKNDKIGVLGTTATIGSKAYEKALHNINPKYQVFSQNCPLFVPIVETGWTSPDDEITRLTTRRYLADIKAAEVDTLILGCTHYPLISDIISDEMGESVTLINAGKEVADYAAKVIERDDLLNDGGTGRVKFFVTDKPTGFIKTAEILLGRKIDDNITQVEIG